MNWWEKKIHGRWESLEGRGGSPRGWRWWTWNVAAVLFWVVVAVGAFWQASRVGGEARRVAGEVLREARDADLRERFGEIGSDAPEEPVNRAIADLAAATREIVSALSGGAVHVVFPQSGLFLVALGLLCVFLAARRAVAVWGADVTRAEAWAHDLWGAERVLLAGVLVVLLPTVVVLYVAKLGDSVDGSGLLELVAGLLVIAPIAVLVGEKRWALLRLWGARLDRKYGGAMDISGGHDDPWPEVVELAAAVSPQARERGGPAQDS